MSETVKYSRDSFERFGDDLCEEMLSYLSFDDCFAYECVAKQWKRVVFNRRYKLYINNKILDGSVYLNCKLKLETITRKCQFINDIVLDVSRNNVGKCLQIIHANCHQIESICIKTDNQMIDIKYSSYRMIVEKFGHNLLKLSLPIHGISQTVDSVKPLLRLTPNLIVCEIKDLNALLEDNCEQFLPKLREISTNIRMNSNVKKFAEMYAKRVKTITLFVYYNVDENCVNSLFTQICRFAKLETLCVNFEKLNSISTETLNWIIMNCRQLSRLTLNRVSNCGDVLRNTKQKAVNLKRLTLSKLRGIDKNVLTFCPNLVHLSLNLDDESAQHIIEDIDKNMPQLKSIDLSFNGRTSHATLRHLSRLKNLISLTIGAFTSIKIDSLRLFIANKPGIRKLDLYIETESRQESNEIIDEFIDLANRNPKRDYVLTIKEVMVSLTYLNKIIKVSLDSRGLACNALTVDAIHLPTNLKYLIQK